MRTLFPLLIVISGLVVLAVRGNSQEALDDPVVKLLSGDRALREEGKKEILAQRERQIARLLEVVKDPTLRTENRAAVVSAIEILGELRAVEAAPVLANLLLFGEKGKVEYPQVRWPHMPRRLRVMGLMPAPDTVAPAARTLVKIGIPSLKPVTEQRLAIPAEAENYALSHHCTWVIRNVLGLELAKAYLTQLIETDERARDNPYVASALNSVEIAIKVRTK